jgi:hypothetical protein
MNWIRRKPILIILLASVVVILILVLTGIVLVVSTRSTPSDQQKRWLMGIPCQSPCWEGIQPGKTSADEALKNLKSNALVTNVTQGDLPNISKGFFDWSWASGKRGGGSIQYGSTRVIEEIRLSDCCIKLGDAISAFGKPDYARVVSRHRYTGTPITLMPPSFVYQFVWIAQGIETSDVIDAEFRIDQDILIESVTLFEPGLKRYLDNTGNFGNYLHPWKGYSSYTTYLVTSTSSRK